MLTYELYPLKADSHDQLSLRNVRISIHCFHPAESGSTSSWTIGTYTEYRVRLKTGKRVHLKRLQTFPNPDYSLKTRTFLRTAVLSCMPGGGQPAISGL